MGVRGLQTYIENYCTNAFVTVYIPELVQKHQKERTPPVIVVDGCSCLRSIYGGIDWVHGGQLKEYANAVKHLVQSFTALGVELVFFFDGPTIARKRAVWIQRRLATLTDIENIFDHLANGNSLAYMDPNLAQIPFGLTSITIPILKDLPHCQVFMSVDECDEEIAMYAVANQCFAILGQDTDFIIFPGNHYYLSMKHLNLEEMTTKFYDRWALANQLNINIELLPVFASLLGNDILPYHKLKNFHNGICKQKSHNFRSFERHRVSFEYLIPAVAAFIRPYVNIATVFERLGYLTWSVFNDKSMEEVLRNSINSYACLQPSAAINTDEQIGEDTWKQIQVKCKKLYQLCQVPCLVYNIVHNLEYEMGTHMEDYSCQHMPVAAIALRPIRQRIYGVLLFESPDRETKRVKEWCVTGPSILNGPTLLKPTKVPEGLHPGLLNLWDQANKSHETDSLRWKLIAWCVSDTLDPEKLKLLKPSHITLCIALYYLTNMVYPCFLHHWELQAFVSQALLLQHYDAKQLLEIRIPKTNTRAIHLATMFLKAIHVVRALLFTCGAWNEEYKMSPLNCFDGKLFQKQYLSAMSNLPPKRLLLGHNDLLESYDVVMDLICNYKCSGSTAQIQKSQV